MAKAAVTGGGSSPAPRTAATGSVPPAGFQPYVAASETLPEFNWLTVVLGALLGILFGASSLYLVLKVGLTVSASIPVAVLSITLFRLFSKVFGLRRATILENNIVQTTGSAGESIAFGVGVTMPALLLLGFELDAVRVVTVGLLGGLLGILMMIPLRRAFIVRQHGRLTYPEGTACADVLIVGEKGGASAATVFAGFGVAFFYKFAANAMKLWKHNVSLPLVNDAGRGLRGGVIEADLAPELLGVGYIIGPKIAATMFSGGVLAYLVFVPLIVNFGSGLTEPLAPATNMLIRDMSVGAIRENYILYIAAGAVTTGGIISMLQAMPLIISSLWSGLGDLKRGKQKLAEAAAAEGNHLPRTERDMPLWLVGVGGIGLVLVLAAVPKLGLGFNVHGLVGAAMIVLFGFLFVTVSARLTGEIGSSSNPISGMTVATLLLTCLVFLLMGRTDKSATLTALTIAAVVCVAASNGGTTAQDLKTGYLVGATPRLQQWAILIGALTSAALMGVTLLLLNKAGTVYSNKPENLPNYRVSDVAALTEMQRVEGPHAADDQNQYHVLNVGQGEIEGLPHGKYLVDDQGKICYLVDPAINGRLKEQDDGTPVANKFPAPKPQLMALIIDGVLRQRLPWEMVVLGVLIAVALELAGVPSLPFAVGIYLPIETSTTIFLGGALRWSIDWIKGRKAGEGDMSPGVLLSSGYIAGGAIAGVIVAFMTFLPDGAQKFIDLTQNERWRLPERWVENPWPALAAFAVLMIFLFFGGLELGRKRTDEPA